MPLHLGSLLKPVQQLELLVLLHPLRHQLLPRIEGRGRSLPQGGQLGERCQLEGPPPLGCMKKVEGGFPPHFFILHS
jgi:hypothetical protein